MKPEQYNQELKNKSFKMMAQAWDAFDHQDIFDALHCANRALCIMYSGSTQAQPELAILKHLVKERHLCFKNCQPEFFESYHKYKDKPAMIFHKKRVSKDFIKFINQTEKILKSVESYNFFLNKKVYYTKEEHQSFNQKQKKVAFWCVGVVVLLCLLFPVYKYLNPLQIYQAQGQIFWKASIDASESEANSLRFKVYGDGQFHDYSINALEPIDCFSIRLDPAGEKNVAIWIDYIEIYSKNLAQPLQYNFNVADGWIASNHTTELLVSDGLLYFKTTGPDPVLRKNKIMVNQVLKIKIRMKVLLYKTYLQWIFS